MAERKAEIRDLALRMTVGAMLTAPVLFAAMAGSFWPVGILANHWLLLALTTPVMFYSGWPIHRTGWLSLLHRQAEMNSLITLGTSAAFGFLCIHHRDSGDVDDLVDLRPALQNVYRFRKTHENWADGICPSQPR